MYQDTFRYPNEQQLQPLRLCAFFLRIGGNRFARRRFGSSIPHPFPTLQAQGDLQLAFRLQIAQEAKVAVFLLYLHTRFQPSSGILSSVYSFFFVVCYRLSFNFYRRKK